MKSLHYLNKYFWKYKWRLLFGILFVIISNLFAIFPVQVIRNAFDVVLETVKVYKLLDASSLQENLYQNLTRVLLAFGGFVLLFALIKGFFLFLMRYTIIIMSRLIEYDLKNEIFDKYQRLDMAFYKENKTGDLMNRISEDVSRVRMYLGPAIMYTINLLVLFILVIITMININPKLTLYVLTPLPILSLCIYVVSHIINRKSERVQAQLSKLSSFAQESFSGIRVLKAYSMHTQKQALFDEACKEYKERSLDLVKVNAFFMPLMTLLIGISTIVTIFIGGKLAIAGEISYGNIAEFVIYVNMLTWPVASLGWVTSLVQRASASQKRINEFLEIPERMLNSASGEQEIKGHIAFKNVRFRYPNMEFDVLRNLSFEVNPGETVAIMGRTGSGKSSVANLISRLYEVQEGEILIDGKNIKEVDLSSLRSSIGYVPQEVFLFSSSIRDNISFGIKQGGASLVMVKTAAKQAHVLHNIEDFPQGFDTMLGERGITLSGGQKQRVSIARAIIKSPKILILDDCLSAVDTETEEIIIRNLKPLFKQRAGIIISHRVSSVKHCDRILFLDDGELLESGTHEELIAREGAYFELYQQQLAEVGNLGSN